MSTLTERLERAEARLTRAQSDAAIADLRAALNTVPEMAAVSGIRRKPNRKADARRFASYDRSAAAHKELTEAAADVERLRRMVEREATDAACRALLTPEVIAAARFVRTKSGWDRVVRVNAKSVTVEGAWPQFEHRVPLADVLEVQR